MRRAMAVVLVLLVSTGLAAQTSSATIVCSGRMYGRAGTVYRQLWRLDSAPDRRIKLSATARHHQQPFCMLGSPSILFLSGKGRMHELWMLDPRTGSEQMLLRTDQDQPISQLLGWTKDARDLVLALDTESGHHLAKLRMADRRLIGLPRAESPALAPDGGRIAFDTSYLSPGSLALSQLLVIDLEGKPVAHLGRGASPSWSPDGEKLIALVGNGSELQVVEVRSRTVARTLPLPAKSERWSSAASLAWSPNSQWVLASSPSQGGADYWLLDLEAREWQYLDRGNGARWSPDGSRLVYSTPPERIKVERKDVVAAHLKTAEAPDFQPRPLTSAPGLFEDPVWYTGPAAALR